jgi:adenosine deaminase
VDDNFSQLDAVFELSDFDKARLAANSIHSSFASEERKAELLAELNGLDAVR